jgi:hypothetical protein
LKFKKPEAVPIQDKINLFRTKKPKNLKQQSRKIKIKTLFHRNLKIYSPVEKKEN